MTKIPSPDTAEDVKPVRAWAEWDEWTGYLPWDQDGALVIPKGGAGDAYEIRHCLTPQELVLWISELGGFGPLRSIRVLLSNGAWVLIETSDRKDGQRGALIYLFKDERQIQRYTENGGLENWEESWYEGYPTDAEAVDRALAEATAWFATQESGV